MNAPDAEAAYASLREALRAARPAQLVGIHSGGSGSPGVCRLIWVS